MLPDGADVDTEGGVAVVGAAVVGLCGFPIPFLIQSTNTDTLA